jgi:FKBP-type peptidyl-prolyl cis-trans isomerase
MLKYAKFAFITVGTGLAVGISTDSWLYVHKVDPALSSVPPGSAPLTSSSLSLSATTDTGAILGIATSTGSVSVAQSEPLSNAPERVAQRAASTNSPRVPGPSEFTAYDQYKSADKAYFGDLVAGTGTAIAPGSLVTVQYRGWLTTGQEFDESYATGKPFTFTEGSHGVIAGWEEGLYGMKVGGKRRLIVPPSVGYGSQGQGTIPGNSVLIFDVELLSVR